MKKYIFDKNDEMLYEVLRDTTIADLSNRETLLKHIKELKIPLERFG